MNKKQNNTEKWLNNWVNDKTTEDKSLEKDILKFIEKNVKKYGYLGTFLKNYEKKLDNGQTVINLDSCNSKTKQIKLLLAGAFRETFIENIADKKIKRDCDFIMMKLLLTIPNKRLIKLFKLYYTNVVNPENYDDKKVKEFWNYMMSEYKDICLTK